MNNDDEKLIRAHRDTVHKAPPHLVHQWHESIDKSAALERGRIPPEPAPRRFGALAFGTAIAVAIAVGIGLGVFVSEPDVPPPVAATKEPPVRMPAAFNRGLQYHLRSSRDRLAEFEASADATALILDIIEQNRLFEAAAERNGTTRVARVLRAFEPILLELAAGDTAPATAQALREQLAFELEVMLTKLAREASEQAQTT